VGDIETIALTMGASWASGINLYATLLVLGYLHLTGSNTLPPDLLIVANPLVMFAAGLMYVVEFFADKIPGVDTSPFAIENRECSNYFVNLIIRLHY